ncbi:hypothetical protein BN189_3720005 [Clostridioides difficile T10]|nr:hypothetical protein BN186_1880005 [Clostridioides difficile E23]CCL89032.1 hypothetical protein BN189_3720005 [Clostridioides difficile T10]
MLYLAHLAQHVSMLSFFTSIQNRIKRCNNKIFNLKSGEIKNEQFKKEKVYYATDTYNNIFANSVNGNSYLDSAKWKF